MNYNTNGFNHYVLQFKQNIWVYLKWEAFTRKQVQHRQCNKMSDKFKLCGFFVLFLIQLTECPYIFDWMSEWMIAIKSYLTTNKQTKQNNKQGRHNWKWRCKLWFYNFIQITTRSCKRMRNIRHSKSTYTVNFQACLLNYHNDSS